MLPLVQLLGGARRAGESLLLCDHADESKYMETEIDQEVYNYKARKRSSARKSLLCRTYLVC